MSYTVKANFIDAFKIGDNINFNLRILKILYKHYEDSTLEDKTLFIKPMVILNTSIAEAILYDFIENRIKNANRSEIIFPDIAVILGIKKTDKFEYYINQAEKHDFFNLKDTNFYAAMHSLRKKRNRIHIQNSKGEEPRDEEDVFDEKIKRLSEKILDKLIERVSKYPRREEYHGYVTDFEIPWDKHFIKPKVLFRGRIIRRTPHKIIGIKDLPF